MPNAAARPEPRGWWPRAAAIVLAITAVRVVLAVFNETDLYVDEAQYWLWGQDLAFGYYSKPPLIAWVIRAFTEIGGSDAPFWVRLPAPLFHAATALVLAAIAARLHSPRAAVLTAAAYATLPMVAVGSLLISTDTIMFPFLALALAGYLGLTAPGGARAWLALGVGAALGLAFLAKYAAVYYLAFGALAALSPGARPRLRDAALILGAFGLVAAPNLAWNLANGFSTVSHTVDNTGWREELALSPARAFRFLAEQALVFGPVFLAALLAASVSRARIASQPLLAALALPIVALVAAQALISGANANWAASAYLAGTLIAVPWMMARRRAWLVAAFAVNGAVALALPMAATQAERLQVGGRLLLGRYTGQSDLTRTLIAEAEARGATAIVAAERGILADLFYTGRNGPVPAFAWPHDGPPAHHYDQRHAFGGDAPGPVLAVSRRPEAPPCAAGTEPDAKLSPGAGAYRGSTVSLWLVPADCWGSR